MAQEFDFGAVGNEAEVMPAEATDNMSIETNSIQDINDKGLTKEEENDPNKIKVTISDTQAPLVILYGPPACGKTMTLARLTRYLQSKGLTVEPIKTFRPAYDSHYKKMCESFNEFINSDDAAASTSRISFMLVGVYEKGKRLCQILEAPGEYYFLKDNPNAPYPAYFNVIKNSSNRKIWSLMVEPDWYDEQDRRNYVTRLTKLKTMLNPQDKIIFLYNKIDLTQYVIRPGQINMTEAKKSVAQLYPAIFEPFRNQNPIMRFVQPYNFDFVPFQTGDYTENTSGMTFTPGPDVYPQKLWEVIRSRIVG